MCLLKLYLKESDVNIIYSNDNCMRMECKHKRGERDIDRIKFLMCSQCKIASYCSRRCAKLDWNKGYHKVYCRVYGELATANSE